MVTVDAHAHLFRPVSVEYPRDVFEPLTPPDRGALADEFLEHMTAAGVDKAVIVALSHHDEYLKEVLTQYPDKFVGVGVENPTASDPLSDLQRRIEDVGIQGLRLLSLGEPGVDPRAQPKFPLLARMAEQDVKLWFYSSPEQVELLNRTLDLLPDLKVVLNHSGFCPNVWDDIRVDEHLRPRFDVEMPPRSLELIEKIAARANVFVHMSGQYAFSKEPYPYADLKPILDRVYQLPGISSEERAAIL